MSNHHTVHGRKSLHHAQAEVWADSQATPQLAREFAGQAQATLPWHSFGETRRLKEANTTVRIGPCPEQHLVGSMIQVRL